MHKGWALTRLLKDLPPVKIPTLLFAAAGLLGACSSSPPLANDAQAVDANAAVAVTTPAENSAAAGKSDADYLGRWIGVEGTYLNVAAKPGGGVTLDMQWDLDHRGRFDGTVTERGIRFVRDDTTEVAVPSDGDATGLKYLAGKTDCLTVKPGEGYCRSR